ncbi:MAG: proton-conducting transporter membrane subunit, partial [Cyanobacteriota bacterium]|nr:proton-conducting transporter membrane subunit [Cyanobacteriota bacterium]
GVVALLPLAGTWNYNGLAEWAKTATVDPTVLTLITLALIAGPLGKCAQFPLHLWLDEAMEGPMPATILRNTVVVSTGAWVLIKLQPVFAISPVALTAMTTIGAATAVGAAAIAIAQIDVKRSLSYSVSAYMGIVFIAVGTQQDKTALVLLLTYAIAMATLVMSIGGIVWNNVTQDLTQYGGLWSRRPVSGLCYLAGAASLVALPPLGCFWALSQMANTLWNTHHPALVGVMILVNGLTAFSTCREFCLMFGGQPTPMTRRSPEALWPLTVPMTVSAGMALHMPLILLQLNLLPQWGAIATPVTVALVSAAIAGAGAAAYIYLGDAIAKPVRLPVKAVQDFFAYDFYTAQLYRLTIVFVVGLVSNIIYWIDRFIVDGIVNLVGLATAFSGQALKYNVSGQTQFYALSIFLSIVLLGIALCWPLLANVSLVFSG